MYNEYNVLHLKPVSKGKDKTKTVINYIKKPLKSKPACIRLIERYLEVSTSIILSIIWDIISNVINTLSQLMIWYMGRKNTWFWKWNNFLWNKNYSVANYITLLSSLQLYIILYFKVCIYFFSFYLTQKFLPFSINFSKSFGGRKKEVIFGRMEGRINKENLKGWTWWWVIGISKTCSNTFEEDVLRKNSVYFLLWFARHQSPALSDQIIFYFKNAKLCSWTEFLCMFQWSCSEKKSGLEKLILKIINTVITAER